MSNLRAVFLRKSIYNVKLRLRSYKFVFVVNMLEDVFGQLNKMSKVFQTKGLDVSRIRTSYQVVGGSKPFRPADDPTQRCPWMAEQPEPVPKQTLVQLQATEKLLQGSLDVLWPGAYKAPKTTTTPTKRRKQEPVSVVSRATITDSTAAKASEKDKEIKGARQRIKLNREEQYEAAEVALQWTENEDPFFQDVLRVDRCATPHTSTHYRTLARGSVILVLLLPGAIRMAPLLKEGRQVKKEVYIRGQLSRLPSLHPASNHGSSDGPGPLSSLPPHPPRHHDRVVPLPRRSVTTPRFYHRVLTKGRQVKTEVDRRSQMSSLPPPAGNHVISAFLRILLLVIPASRLPSRLTLRLVWVSRLGRAVVFRGSEKLKPKNTVVISALPSGTGRIFSLTKEAASSRDRPNSVPRRGLRSQQKLGRREETSKPGKMNVGVYLQSPRKPLRLGTDRTVFQEGGYARNRNLGEERKQANREKMNADLLKTLDGFVGLTSLKVHLENLAKSVFMNSSVSTALTGSAEAADGCKYYTPDSRWGLVAVQYGLANNRRNRRNVQTTWARYRGNVRDLFAEESDAHCSREDGCWTCPTPRRPPFNSIEKPGKTLKPHRSTGSLQTHPGGASSSTG
ncbi:hypothetical protein Bbelb_349680 [Branchiostoma belcheri]|nr:hypothetical protein Bbelb_349680 [Branchiostoma belcheri]